MSNFDELDSNFGSEKEIDDEMIAKENYMKRLMNFRKDELVLPEESDDDDGV